jgi:CheY-like chemotaxis protein
MRDIIEPEGYATLLAESGEEALDIVAKEQVHVVLMDVQLPRISGLDALKLLHQFRSQLPCILMTANATHELMRQAFQAHAYSVIPKPVNKNVVLYTVVRALMRVYPQGPSNSQKAS